MIISTTQALIATAVVLTGGYAGYKAWDYHQTMNKAEAAAKDLVSGEHIRWTQKDREERHVFMKSLPMPQLGKVAVNVAKELKRDTWPVMDILETFVLSPTGLVGSPKELVIDQAKLPAPATTATTDTSKADYEKAMAAIVEMRGMLKKADEDRAAERQKDQEEIATLRSQLKLLEDAGVVKTEKKGGKGEKGSEKKETALVDPQSKPLTETAAATAS